MGTRGETDEYFEEGRAFIESLPISQLHVFTYSERPNTQALKIEHEVTPQEKHRRCKVLLDISDQKLHEFYASQKGETKQVLFESNEKGDYMHGFTENYIRVEAPYDESKVNAVEKVELDTLKEDLTAYLV